MNKKTFSFILLMALFIAAAVLLSPGRGLNYPDYTSFSAKERGVCLLYDSLLKMGLPVAVSNLYIDENTSLSDLQIIVAPETFYFHKEKEEALALWIFKGGNLLFFESPYESHGLYELLSTANVRYFNNLTLYEYGMGKAFFAPAALVLNETLMENSDAAGRIFETVTSSPYEKIIFNESVHGYALKENFLDNFPFGVRLVFFQIIIISIAAVLYMGRRFGRPKKYYEEIEREENEYVYTLSNLYRSAGEGGAAVKAYSKKLGAGAKKYFDLSAEPGLLDIYTLWKENNLPELYKLEYIIQNQGEGFNTKKASQRRNFNKTINYLRDLIKVLR